VPSSPQAPTASETLSPDSIAVTLVDGLSVRVDPSISAALVGILGAAGEAVFVVSGPVPADGHDWYQLASVPPDQPCAGSPEPPLACFGWFGWVAGTSASGDAWLGPRTGDCVNGPVNTEAFLSLFPQERLSCFGDSILTLRFYKPGPIPAECPMTPFTHEPDWLNGCARVGYLAPDEDSGLPGLFVVHVSPDLGPCQFGGNNPECPLAGLDGQWVEVRGHLDDPAAESCVSSGPPTIAAPGPDSVILGCRLAFVVTEVTPTSAP
jgi:hypothetical protein